MKNISKNNVLALLVAALSFVNLLSGCAENVSSMEPDTETRDAVAGIFRELAALPRSAGKPDYISAAILDWAAENGFSALRDESGSILVEKPAAEGFADLPVVTFHSRMDMRAVFDAGLRFDPEEDAVPLVFDERKGLLRGDGVSLGAASALGVSVIEYVMTQPEARGPMRALFTLGEGADPDGGMKNVDPSWLAGGVLIDLNWDSDKSFGTASPLFSTVRLSKPAAWTAPSSKNAYVLAADGFSGAPLNGLREEGSLNPVKVLAELLAKAKGDGIAFELAGLRCEASEGETPHGASAVLILNDYELKKFKELFRKYRAAFRSDRVSGESEAELFFIQTKMPEQALAFEDAGAVITLLYSVFDGVRQKDGEGRTLTSSSLSGLRLGDDLFSADVHIVSADPDGAASIESDLAAIASLCGLSIEKRELAPLWRSEPSGPLISAFTTAYRRIRGADCVLAGALSASGLGFFAEKNPDLEILSIGGAISGRDGAEESLSLDSAAQPAALILEYMDDILAKTAVHTESLW
jgi:dipeptidase D